MGCFEIKDRFYLNGKPFQIISGSIHYFRVVPEYWEHRLMKLKAMGCNTVETYIPWNFHEPRKGEFDFSGMRDVEAFIRLAQKAGLYVILRPSPYICAEWEFGGLPAWLLKDGAIKLRCCEGLYLKHALEYYDELIPRLAPLQITCGGPVIMLQVENEYGSYGNDHQYLAALRDAMISRGIDVPLVTSDGPTDDMLACGHVDGVFQTGNFGSHAREQFSVLTEHGIAPLMCMEFWVGWFDHWGNGGHKTTDPEACAADFRYMLENGNVNIYMFHGGTSFGLMNGSNYYDALTPDVTSYDYDALLTEDGRATEKYRLFQRAIAEHTGANAAATEPEDIPRRAYGAARGVGSAALIALAEKLPCVHGKTPRSMERLGQDYGYVLYRTHLNDEKDLYSIRLCGANDRAIILLNGKPILTMYDRELLEQHVFSEPIHAVKGAVLDILVENMGRVNYGWKLECQQKGIDGSVVINNHHHYEWDMYCLDEKALAHMEPADAPSEGVPGAHSMVFDVDAPADTYLALPGWGKGVCFINGFTLGRFWEIGPQQTLYIPAPLLKKGENRLLIIETEGKTGEAILTDAPNLG